jgi:hypothetical protein
MNRRELLTTTVAGGLSDVNRRSTGLGNKANRGNNVEDSTIPFRNDATVVKNPSDDFQQKLETAISENATLYVTAGRHTLTEKVSISEETGISIIANPDATITREPYVGRTLEFLDCKDIHIEGGKWDHNGHNRKRELEFEHWTRGEFGIIRCEDIKLCNQSHRDNITFTINVDGCTNANIHDISLFSYLSQVGVDGIHLGTVRGDTSNVRISDIYAKTGDDTIALTALDKGSIYDVSISDCHVRSTQAAGLKILTNDTAGGEHACYNISVDNLHVRSNEFRDAVEITDTDSNAGPGQVRNITLDVTIDEAKTTGVKILDVVGVQARIFVDDPGGEALHMENTSHFSIDLMGTSGPKTDPVEGASEHNYHLGKSGPTAFSKDLATVINSDSGILQIAGTSPETADSVVLEGSQDVRVTGTIDGNGGGTGINLADVSDTIISNCRVFNHENAIEIDADCSDLLVTGNHTRGNDSGISAPEGNNSVIEHNLE